MFRLLQAGALVFFAAHGVVARRQCTTVLVELQIAVDRRAVDRGALALLELIMIVDAFLPATSFVANATGFIKSTPNAATYTQSG